MDKLDRDTRYLNAMNVVEDNSSIDVIGAIDKCDSIASDNSMRDALMHLREVYTSERSLLTPLPFDRAGCCCFNKDDIVIDSDGVIHTPARLAVDNAFMWIYECWEDKWCDWTSMCLLLENDTWKRLIDDSESMDSTISTYLDNFSDACSIKDMVISVRDMYSKNKSDACDLANTLTEKAEHIDSIVTSNKYQDEWTSEYPCRYAWSAIRRAFVLSYKDKKL